MINKNAFFGIILAMYVFTCNADDFETLRSKYSEFFSEIDQIDGNEEKIFIEAFQMISDSLVESAKIIADAIIKASENKLEAAKVIAESKRESAQIKVDAIVKALKKLESEK